jgi:hypothetical protein
MCSLQTDIPTESSCPNSEIILHDNHKPNVISVCIRHCLRHHLPTAAPRYQLKPVDYKESLDIRTSLPVDAAGNVMPPVTRPATTTRMRSTEENEGDSPGMPPKPTKDVDIDFKAFAPSVFASMRAAMGISHDEYLTASAMLAFSRVMI